MKRMLLLSILVLSAAVVFGQRKPFEGTMIMKQASYMHQGKASQVNDVQIILMKGQKSIMKNSAGQIVIIDYSSIGNVITTSSTKANSGKYIALRMTMPLDMSVNESYKQLAESPVTGTSEKFNFEWEKKQFKDQKMDMKGDFNKDYYQQMGDIEYMIASTMTFTTFNNGEPFVTSSTDLIEFTPKPISDEVFELSPEVIICNSVSDFQKSLMVENAKIGKAKKGSAMANTKALVDAMAGAPTNSEQVRQSIIANPVVPESLWEF